MLTTFINQIQLSTIDEMLNNLPEMLVYYCSFEWADLNLIGL